MNSTSITRQRILIAVALLVLGVYASLSVSDARTARIRLQQARADLAEVREKLNQIERVKQAPRVAALEEETPDEIVNRIAAALRTAGLPPATLIDQTTPDPVRIPRTDFKQRAITINLNASPLNRVVRFCDALRDDQTGTTVRDLILTEPRNAANDGGQEKWEAELTLTQMIFSPTSG